METALLAEIRGEPSPQTVNENQVIEAFKVLYSSMPEEKVKRLGNILGDLSGASDSDACWAGLTLYEGVSRLDKPYNTILARALIQPEGKRDTNR